MPEITDQELAAAREAIKLLTGLNANPEARALLEKSVKVIKPEIETTEDQAAKLTAPLMAEIQAMKDQYAADAEARAKAAQEENDAAALGRLEAAFGRLRDQGLTADGEERVKKIMVERGVADPESAFAYFEKTNPKPAPEAAGWVPDQWKYDTDAVTDTKALFQDADRWADDMVGQVLLEERRNALDS